MAYVKSPPEEMIQRIWRALCSRGFAHLDRVRGYLWNMLDGGSTPENRSNREFFRHLYVPGLGAGPYFDPDDLPPLHGIAELAAIQEEARSAFKQRALLTDHSDLVVGSDPTAKAGWDCLYFRKQFADVKETRLLFPSTSAYLRRHRLAAEALFSRLAPKTNIESHSDRANYVATVHIPLSDSSAVICVSGIEKVYIAGQPIFFDSSFVHSVDNKAAVPRDILLFNVWHPDLSDEEISAIEIVRELWDPSIAFDPDDGFSALEKTT